MLPIIQVCSDKIRSFAQAIDASPNDGPVLEGYRDTFKQLAAECAAVRSANPALSQADSASLEAARIMCDDIGNQSIGHINSLMVRVHAYIGKAPPSVASVTTSAAQAKTSTVTTIVVVGLGLLILFLGFKK